MQLVFPNHGDLDFSKKLTDLTEYQLFSVPAIPVLKSKEDFDEKVEAACGIFEKAAYQHLVQHYLSKRSPYRSLLLYHGLGVGKTCSSITLAESFLLDHTMNQPPKILVVSTNTLHKSYEEQIFSLAKSLNPEEIRNQCTGDTYAKLVHGSPSSDTFVRRLQQLIRSRYLFLSYDGIVKYVATNPEVNDKVIIIDEAHKLRQSEVEKKAAKALESMLEKGQRNRLILLSATPMYDEPDEILWLLGLLLRNDHRMDEVRRLPQSVFQTTTDISPRTAQLLGSYAAEYVSYIRGRNPFTFAARVHPKDCGATVLQDSWALPIHEGIVPSRAGDLQITAPPMGGNNTNEKNVMSKQIQWLNITYPNGGHGESGLMKMFSKVGEDPFPIAYKQAFRDALSPSPHGSLSRYAAKIQTIMDTVRVSEGIVLIYSHLVWSGILPIAIALEHCGFQRFGGTSLLHRASVIPAPYKYPGTPNPRYCILSGDAKVMGSTQIDQQISRLLRDINHPNNLHGEEIKVVLITPIAGEGLSLQNVRSVHIMEPWYHMNRIEQVIGRAIRTCSHVRLPIEERNVSIWLHACTSDANDTADVHAYKIAARKLYQVKKVESLLRDHAMDCSLLFHLNFYPTSSFKFQVMMRTSQGTLMPYAFGDDELDKPSCGPVVKKGSDVTMRDDAYASFIPTVVRRLERHIRGLLPQRLYFSHKELLEVAKVPEEVLLQSLQQLLYPNQWMKGFDFYEHRLGYVFVPYQKAPVVTEIALPLVKDKVESACSVDVLLRIPTQNEFAATVMAYQTLDSSCWKAIAEEIVSTPALHAHPVVQLLVKQGMFILKHEVLRWKGPDAIIGYVDIFQPEKFVGWLYDEDDWRYASQQEAKQILEKRKAWEVDQDTSVYGMMEPTRFSKDTTKPLQHVLKLMVLEKGDTKRRGVACTSKPKQFLEDMLQTLGQQQSRKNETKDQLCLVIAFELLRINRLKLNPVWKPLSKHI